MQRLRARPARAQSHSSLLYLSLLSFFSVLRVSQGIKVTRTVIAEDLVATSVSVLGVGPDGLTTFLAFEQEEVGGTDTITQVFLANSVILIESDLVGDVTEVDSCDLTSSLAGLVQCVDVSPDSSGHLETETVAAGVNTLSYVVDVADGNGSGGSASSSSSPSGAASPSPSPSLTGHPHSSNSSPSIATTSSSSSTTPSRSNPASQNKSNVGTIVGAILGSIAVFLLVLLLTLYLLRKKRLNRSHQDVTPSVAAPFAEISVRRHPTLTPFALTGTADGIGDPRLGPDAGFMKKNQTSGSVSELTTSIGDTSPDNSSQGAFTNARQPPITSSTIATTSVPVNAVPNPSPRPGNSGNNVLIEAMYHLQERLAKLENQIPAAQDPSAVPRMSHADGFGDEMVGRAGSGYFFEGRREDPPTYVA